MPLYHKEIGFPKNMKFRPVANLIPSGHALREASSDRYGAFTIPSEFDPVSWDVIEIEVANGALHKIVARKQYDATRDIVMAFLVRDRVIKTVWINERNDAHKTLDRSAYAKP